MPVAADPMEYASALHLIGREAQAEARYREILAGAPEHRAARNNLISLLNAAGRWEAAQVLLREGAALFPSDLDLRVRLAYSLLATGDYEEGWRYYEGRRGAVASNGVRPPTLSIPEWGGEAIESLLIWPEQGFGDMIQFARFAPVLEQRGVRTTLLCPPELARLFATAGLNAWPLEDGVKIEGQQAWSLMASLPRLLGVTIETIPPPLALRGTARGPAGGVGFVGRGRATHNNDANRSLPGPLVEAMLKLPGIVSLDPAETGALDFQDTADVIAGLDHVLTVDTSVAHLAASMGKPVSVLLPRLNTDWRWMHGRADSPWYPSVRLYRQAVAGQWRAVLDAALEDIGDLAGRPAPERPRLAVEVAVAPAAAPSAATPAAKAAPQPAPQPAPAQASAAKAEMTVWLVSSSNDGNFGERLGAQVLSGLLPANARLRRIHHKPWDAQAGERPDLLIVGAGASLSAALLTPELLDLADRAERSIGLFGLQYREAIDARLLAGLLDRLDGWWARDEQDARLHGAARNNVRHLGHLAMDAFPLARWTLDQTLEVGPEVLGNAPLDRTIERIQAYRRVSSGRLHPLLCALTSAEAVSYAEQYETDGQTPSGKFQSLLMDVFGTEMPQGRFWDVDRAAVGAYKAKVRAGLDHLRAELARMLN